MTSANETPTVAGARGAAGCATEWSLMVTNENVNTPAPTAPASQPKRAEALFPLFRHRNSPRERCLVHGRQGSGRGPYVDLNGFLRFCNECRATSGIVKSPFSSGRLALRHGPTQHRSRRQRHDQVHHPQASDARSRRGFDGRFGCKFRARCGYGGRGRCRTRIRGGRQHPHADAAAQLAGRRRRHGRRLGDAVRSVSRRACRSRVTTSSSPT